MADKEVLVQQVKDWQRQGEGYKQSWYNWISQRDSSGTFDPNRHETSTLEEFLTAANSGMLEVPDVSSCGDFKGKSRGKGKGWGGYDGCGGCGSFGGCGGCGGYGGCDGYGGTSCGGDSWGGGGWAAGGNVWGTGKGGGKWDGGGGGGMNPWDMMGMMQQMWQWASSKGLTKGSGKDDGQKRERSTELGGSSKPGDWVCPGCQNVNFSHRDSCNKCGSARQGQKRLGMKPGDWICPACGDLVFASKSQCKMCSTPKPLELQEGSSFAANSYGAGSSYGKGGNGQNMKPGDWICPNPACGDLVFASRSACKLCGTPKQDGGYGSSGARYSPY